MLWVKVVRKLMQAHNTPLELAETSNESVQSEVAGRVRSLANPVAKGREAVTIYASALWQGHTACAACGFGTTQSTTSDPIF